MKSSVQRPKKNAKSIILSLFVDTPTYLPEENGAERVEDGAFRMQTLGHIGRRAKVLEGELLDGAANVVCCRVEHSLGPGNAILIEHLENGPLILKKK